MAASTIEEESRIVSIARIAAELQSVMGVAWGVSLAAKNAMVMSAQAGDKAKGFKPVTEFIDEISKQAISGVVNINREALKLSRISVAEERARDANDKFLSVMKKNKKSIYINTLKDGIFRVERKMHVVRQEFKDGLKVLVASLESMDECMKSAKCIASVARIVISDAQEYRDNLTSVADNLDEAAVYIKEKVNNSYYYLQSISISK